jgi:UDP-N-acetylglucosamine 3-dehydrogenase
VIRLGLIGCGTIAEEEHLPAFATMADVEIAALADIDARRLAYMGDKYCVAARYRDYRAMLAAEHLDAVSICTPNYVHASMTIDCCRAGASVLVEKPAATSMAEIARMKAAAAKAGVIVMVEQTHRFIPINEKARQIVRSGALGRIVGFRGTVRSGGPAYWAPKSKWFFTKSEAFGGVLADTGIHLIDALRWITGQEIARVQGFTANMRGKGDVEDAASITFETAAGVVGVLDMSWNQQPGVFNYQIFGSEGFIETTNYKGLRGMMREPRAEVSYDIKESSEHVSPFRYFVDCVVTGEKPFVGLDEGGRSLAVVLAGYRSAATGKAATVAEL